MVNATEFPAVPSQPWQEMQVDGAAAPSLLLTAPQWLDNTRPFQGFAPTYGANLGTILTALRIPDLAIPRLITSTSTGMHSLDPDIIASWSSIEKTVDRISHFLLKALEHLPSPRQPRPPTAYGYASEHSTKQAAIDSVFRSRDAFDLMLIHVSFALAHWRFHACTYPLDGVLSYFERHHPEEYPTLYDLVTDSCVGDFRAGTRAGYFIDLFTYPGDWIPYLHVWAEAGIPLWIYAGPQPDDCVDAYLSASPDIRVALRDWMPNRLILAAAFGKFLSGILKHSPPPPPSFENRDVQGRTLLVPALKSFAIVHGDYEHGMTPGQYFDCKKRSIDRWSSSNWISKDAVAYAVRVGDCSKWRVRFLGYRMFVWECEREVWHRRAVENHAKRAFFELHAPSQRHWCPLAEEVDLCWFLDPSAGVVDLSVHSTGANRLSSPLQRIDTSTTYLSDARLPNDTIDPFARESNTTLSAPAASPRELPVLTPRSPSQVPSDESDYSSDFENPATPRPLDISSTVGFVPPRPWKSTLERRLGYDTSRRLPPWHTARSTPLFANPEHRLSNVLKCLGDNSPLESEGIVASAVDAIDTLGGTGSYGRKLLPSCWDISPLRYDKPRLPPGLSAYQIHYQGESGLIRRCVLATDSQALHNQWWVFSMTSTALVQVLRSEHTGMLAIGRYLISCGIPFNTTIATAHPIPIISRQIARQGLGSLTSEEAFTGAKYQHYEGQRDAALAAGLGALALKAGGIIWRLSIETATPRLVKDALRPPKMSASQTKFVCGELGEYSFVSDQLQPHELDIILGAYRMKKKLSRRSGKSSTGTGQSAEEEWSSEGVVFLWPTEYAWLRSGLNIGEWSRECEAWYQTRLASLRAGTAKPLSSADWKSSLRKITAARTVWETYDTLVHETFFDT